MGRVNTEQRAFYDAVASRIRGLIARPDCRLTTARLARRVGWSRASLSGFLNRTSLTISAYLLARIAAALHVTAGYLMKGDDRRLAEPAKIDDASPP